MCPAKECFNNMELCGQQNNNPMFKKHSAIALISWYKHKAIKCNKWARYSSGLQFLAAN
jgi:hypothetical protein